MPDHQNDRKQCDHKCGRLPDCAPLAAAYVPNQCDADTRYENDKALSRGTLFPGLDLPLGNIVNQQMKRTPRNELMAISFAAHDLALYLDTHAEDAEAFAVYKELLSLYEEGCRRYREKYGPLLQSELKDAKTYSWLGGAWPWELGADPEV